MSASALGGALTYMASKAKHRWWRRLWICGGLSLGAVAVVLFVSSRAVLNGYAKGKVERAFALAHPGCALRIGVLEYAVGANRLVADSVTLETTNASFRSGRISLTGVRWQRLLWGTAPWAVVLDQTDLDAASLDWRFPRSHYAIRCARLRASVPNSKLLAEHAEVRSLIPDDALFAASDFRTTRFHLILPEFRVVGLAYADLLAGKSYRASSVLLSRPSLDVLVNRDKPMKPFLKSPLMLVDALAAIPQPLQVNRLTIANGELSYSEQVVAGAPPGSLTFTAVDMSAEGLGNHGGPPANIQIQAQGNLMTTARLKVVMTIPVAASDLSLHYSGSLNAMDLTRLGAFLEIADHLRIKSGSAQEATFDNDVSAGRARGQVHALYHDLKIAFLDPQTASEKGVVNRVSSFLVNTLKIRDSNLPDPPGSIKVGEVNYTRKPADEFLQFTWFALRSGVLDVISH